MTRADISSRPPANDNAGHAVARFSARVTTTEYFGGCPHCGRNDGGLNIERAHWHVCHRHRTKWRIGENLFSHWRGETDKVWQNNGYLLAMYQEVDPKYPKGNRRL